MQYALEEIFEACAEHRNQKYDSGNLTISQYHLNIALWLIDMGYYVFPVMRNKRPFYKFSWNELSTNDRNIAIQYWQKYPNSMVAIDCRKSGIVVVDVDEKPESNKQGFKVLEKCFEQWGNLDPTMPIVVSASGGLHIYAKDDGVKYIPQYENCIDIRQPHYIISPYSINENEGLYKVLNEFCATDKLVPLPKSWSDGFKTHSTGATSKATTTSSKTFSTKKKVYDIDPTPLFDKCEFLKKVRDESETLPEPLWFSFAIWCSGFKNGNEIFHEYSSDYPNYTYKEAQAKYEHSSNRIFSCNKMREMFDCCQNCKKYKGENNDTN